LKSGLEATPAIFAGEILQTTPPQVRQKQKGAQGRQKICHYLHTGISKKTAHLPGNMLNQQ